jgi:ribosome-associated protein
MDGQNLLFITPTLSIPLSELTFRFSRSGGPGGQHVNRSETRVELIFDVAHSPSLSEAQREKILDRLSRLIDQEGVLRLTASETRSQHQNRERAQIRFQNLLQSALKPRKRRRPTRPTRASVERRLEDKRRRSARKRERRRKDW